MTENEATAHGHPRGLYTLFGAEAWERFSYYGMRAILVLYLVNRIHFPREQALEIYGMYTGLVYLTPMLGGYLADKILGRRKSVLIGGIVMALGQLAMAFEPLLFPALGLLIVGNGFFKPNISTMVGGLYKDGDPRRDGAFTIFYMGINLGAFFSPIVCGYLGEKVGFRFGFGAAAIGMVFGLVQFVGGQKFLGATGLPPGRVPTEPKKEAPLRDQKAGGGEHGTSWILQARDYVDVAIWSAGSCALVWGALFLWKAVGPMWSGLPGPAKLAVLFVALGVVFFQLFRQSTKVEVQQLVVVVVLCAFNIFFWMGFEQAGGTMTLFADQQTDRMLGPVGCVIISIAVFLCAYNFRRSTRNEPSGKALWVGLSLLFVLAGAGGLVAAYFAARGQIEIPASQFQAINPLLIVALAPTFSNLWDKLDAGRFRSSTPTKMAIGMVILGLGFGVLFLGQTLAGAGKASAGWLAAVYAIHTVGELCLSPIGLSMVTKLAPPRVASLAMGLWLGSSAAANYLAGTLESMLKKVNLPIYGFLIASSIGPALLLVLLTPILKRWMHGKA